MLGPLLFRLRLGCFGEAAVVQHVEQCGGGVGDRGEIGRVERACAIENQRHAVRQPNAGNQRDSGSRRGRG